MMKPSASKDLDKSDSHLPPWAISQIIVPKYWFVQWEELQFFVGTCPSIWKWQCRYKWWESRMCKLLLFLLEVLQSLVRFIKVVHFLISVIFCWLIRDVLTPMHYLCIINFLVLFNFLKSIAVLVPSFYNQENYTKPNQRDLGDTLTNNVA